MRTRTKGIQVAEGGGRTVEKVYKGQRIFARLGEVSQDEAEAWLRDQQAAIDIKRSQGTQRNFALAADKYLTDCEKRGVRTLDLIAYHITLILPYIGFLPLESVHSGSLESFCDSRIQDDEVKPATVNRTLEVVRSILTKCARVWRTDEGKAWLPTAPLIEMLDTKQTKRQPYPITWDEQKRLFAELPPHLERMALFAVNTGLRDDNVCGLRWSWERYIPELKRSVFVVPASEFKGKRPHVAILNDVAMSVMESCRGVHKEFVFTYKQEVKDKKLPQHEPDRVDTINNTGWQKARSRANLTQVRVHDLRHTFGQRLRAAGVSSEDRKALMGHATSDMSEHYATPTIARLIEMANLVASTRDTPTILRVVNG
ncbi:tyrosine-type recombinase/integrase [Collimonas humicola]|uniref:tyrosine-type recombinase/integrase n=1 Tax=Collimonas humicola TaxID=2825886 RepID=UPI001E4F2006|nr:site-specific integrase [Collimonas humicola]